MKAIFSPGPSYTKPETRKFAGWLRIFDIYKEALEELGYEVFIPAVPPELIDQASTVSKILSYDVVAASQLPLDADLFLGPPGYSLAQLMRLQGISDWITFRGLPSFLPLPKLFLFVFNNADWFRDEQLPQEYKRFDAPYDLSPTWRWINKTAVELADHIIAPSPFVKGTWAKVVPEEKISIAFWGVDSEMFSPAPEEPYVPLRVLFVGGDPIRKGLWYLIQAWKGMKDVELWIVGCTPFKEVLDPTVKQFGMVPFEKMPEIYRQCHVLVLPTLEDGIALCVQEAMASGLVPIATPDPAEVFVDGVSGIKIPYRDPAAIAAALNMLKDNPDRRREMAAAARKLAETQPWSMTKDAVKQIIRRELGQA